MDCEHCQSLLLELASGDLDPERSAQARAHTQDCEGCSAELQRLQRALDLSSALPIEDPPEHLTTRVLELAQAHSRSLHAMATLPAPRPSPLQQLLDAVARLATSRQVAMATVVLVVLAAGVWTVPKLTHRREVAGGTVVSPDPAGEVAPSAELEPADRLELSVDLRRGRIRAKGQAAPPPSTPASSAQAPQPSDDVPPSPAPEQAASKAPPEGDGTAVATSARTRKAAPQRKAASKARAKGTSAPQGLRKREAFAETKQAAPVADSEAQFAPAPPAHPAPLGKVSKARQQRGGTVGGGSLSELLQPRSASGGPPAAAEARPGAIKPKSVAQGASNAASEADEAQGGDDRQAAAQLLGQARKLRKSKGCRAALKLYAQAHARAPASPAGGSALLEAARCQLELGDSAQAISTLKRASRITSSAAAARRMLQQLQPAPAEPSPEAQPAAEQR